MNRLLQDVLLGLATPLLLATTKKATKKKAAPKKKAVRKAAPKKKAARKAAPKKKKIRAELRALLDARSGDSENAAQAYQPVGRDG